MRRRQTDEEIEKQKKQQKIRISASKAARRSGKVTKREGKVSKSKGRAKTPRSQKKIATIKKSKQEILDEFKGRYDADKIQKILEFSEIKGNIKEVEEKIDTTQLDSWDYLKQLIDSLENRGVSNVRINFGIVRGIDYYSGTVFEVYDKNSTLGALAGGGRYDSLTKAFGREDIGATGVAGGVERIILTMQEQKIISDTKQPRVSVLYTNEDMQKVAMSIASLLRLANIPTNIDLAGKVLKKQMDQATDSRYCIIVGPKELDDGKVVLRDIKWSCGT